ncbi:nuclear transport factor 2 family protein [Desertimonas flava]|uniref:nuclear transport factor 2 family protein n=1 Tax=Desertimonas flava TaxID=2064846 RepID=UPI000E3415A9|nr:nuclear transport factor 2 family protein [Desertimonas flava]
MTTPTTRVELGDPLPAELAAYYDAIDAGRAGDAAACFSDDATYAVPPPDGIETDPRSVCNGRSEIASHLDQRAERPHVHTIVLCTVEGQSVALEGLLLDRHSGEAQASFAASLQLAGDGTIGRYLAYASPVVHPQPAVANPSAAEPGVAIDKIHEYFHALDDSRFEDAAGCFSLDTLYSHPPYKDPTVGGPGRAEFRGRAELTAAFHRRGAQRIDHRIVFHAQRGPHLLLEGIVNDDAGALLGSFVSQATLDEAGLIRRYASWYTQPGVGRR